MAGDEIDFIYQCKVRTSFLMSSSPDNNLIAPAMEQLELGGNGSVRMDCMGYHFTNAAKDPME